MTTANSFTIINNESVSCSVSLTLCDTIIDHIIGKRNCPGETGPGPGRTMVLGRMS